VRKYPVPQKGRNAQNKEGRMMASLLKRKGEGVSRGGKRSLEARPKKAWREQSSIIGGGGGKCLLQSRRRGKGFGEKR